MAEPHIRAGTPLKTSIICTSVSQSARRAGSRPARKSATGLSVGRALGSAAMGPKQQAPPPCQSTIPDRFRSPSTAVSDRLAVLPQYLMPKLALTRLAGWAAGARWGSFTTWSIGRFVRRYGVNMAEAANPDIAAYP